MLIEILYFIIVFHFTPKTLSELLIVHLVMKNESAWTSLPKSTNFPNCIMGKLITKVQVVIKCISIFDCNRWVSYLSYIIFIIALFYFVFLFFLFFSFFQAVCYLSSCLKLSCKIFKKDMWILKSVLKIHLGKYFNSI